MKRRTFIKSIFAGFAALLAPKAKTEELTKEPQNQQHYFPGYLSEYCLNCSWNEHCKVTPLCAPLGKTKEKSKLHKTNMCPKCGRVVKWFVMTETGLRLYCQRCWDLPETKNPLIIPAEEINWPPLTAKQVKQMIMEAAIRSEKAMILHRKRQEIYNNMFNKATVRTLSDLK